jgi:hypothetical protein
MRRSPRKNIQTRKTNKMNRQEASNHSSSIEDLNAPDPEAIKGGLSTQIKRIVILKSSVNQAETAEDEPVRGFTLNHNETLAEEEDVEAEVIDDLPVEEDEQVKGGPGGWAPAAFCSTTTKRRWKTSQPMNPPAHSLTCR